jgi:hypothetical protein
VVQHLWYHARIQEVVVGASSGGCFESHSKGSV